jgi:hypothetical protein
MSYSLYLVHWPVIVFLAALMPRGGTFFLAATALTFALTVGCYHFVERPLRYVDWRKTCASLSEVRRGHFQLQPPSRYAAATVLVLLAVGLTAYAIGFTARPAYFVPPAAAPSPTTAPASTISAAARPAAAVPEPAEPTFGPLTSALQQQITAALSATQWPQLDPSMDAALTEPWPSEIYRCSETALPSDEQCTWGSPSAPTRIVVVGDSVAMTYANSLRELALNSRDPIQVHVEAMGGCPFINDQTFSEDRELGDACPARNQQAVDYINATKPTAVIIANNYASLQRAGEEGPVAEDEWVDSVRQIVAKFRDSATKIVFLSAPPADKNIEDCYGSGSGVPANCISRVTDQWLATSAAEKRLAAAVGGVWMDSRPWFCSEDGRCPSFVGSAPTKRDAVHMTRSFGELIVHVIGESLKAAGVY